MHESNLAGDHVEHLFLVINTGVLEVNPVEAAIGSLHLSRWFVGKVLDSAGQAFCREDFVFAGDDAKAFFDPSHLLVDFSEERAIGCIRFQLPSSSILSLLKNTSTFSIFMLRLSIIIFASEAFIFISRILFRSSPFVMSFILRFVAF